MTQRIMRYLSADQRSFTFADPLNSRHTLRVIVDRADKTMNGIKLQNVNSQFIVNAMNPVVSGDNIANDAISLRLSISGSTASKAIIAQKWADLKVNVDLALRDVTDGFPVLPSTAFVTDVAGG